MTTHARLCNDDFVALRSLARRRWVQGREIEWKINRRWRCVPYHSAALDAAERLIGMGLVENFVCCNNCGEVFQLTDAGRARTGQIDKLHAETAVRTEDKLMLEFTTDPIEAEVSKAVAGYKLALIRTGHGSAMHRFLCWIGDKEAVARAASLVRAEQNVRAVADVSPAHRTMLEKIIRSLPIDTAERDKMISLLSGSQITTENPNEQ